MVFAVILQVYSYCYNVVMYLFGVILHESYNCTVTILQGYLHALCTILYTIVYTASFRYSDNLTRLFTNNLLSNVRMILQLLCRIMETGCTSQSTEYLKTGGMYVQDCSSYSSR